MTSDNKDVDDFVYETDKEIFKTTDKYVEITFNDKTENICIGLNKDFVNKVNDAFQVSSFDPQSIVKAPSTGKWYCEALSKPSSQKYWNIDDIAHLPENATDRSLNKFISGEYNNNLKLDAKGLLKANTPQYKKILTEREGHFSNNTWTFNHSLITGTNYFFLFDINKLIADVRPFQISFASIPFKISTLKQTFQITGIDGSIKGWISISLDTKDGIIVITSNVLSASDEISIYELETQMFSNIAERGW